MNTANVYYVVDHGTNKVAPGPRNSWVYYAVSPLSPGNRHCQGQGPGKKSPNWLINSC